MGLDELLDQFEKLFAEFIQFRILSGFLFLRLFRGVDKKLAPLSDIISNARRFAALVIFILQKNGFDNLLRGGLALEAGSS